MTDFDNIVQRLILFFYFRNDGCSYLIESDLNYYYNFFFDLLESELLLFANQRSLYGICLLRLPCLPLSRPNMGIGFYDFLNH